MTHSNGKASLNGSSSRKLKVFWVSDGPFHNTGYGITTDHLTRRMVEDGHDVYIFSPGAFHGGQFDDPVGRHILGASFGDDRWGNNTLNFWLFNVQPDVCITWLDAQGMGAFGWSHIPTIMWAPMDTWPLPKQERVILERAARILVPSKWGQQVLADAGLKADYVPCGIDLDHYNITAEGRARWRKQLRPPVDDDTFLIGMVGLNTGNPDRKGYGFAFDIIKEFSGRHPNTRAYIHTNAEGDGNSINLVTLREELGLEDVVCFSRPGGPVGEMPLYLRDMYNAFDVFMHTGNSEGFGIPIIEAQACGTPVVVNRASSATELVGPTGYTADPACDFIVSTCTRIAIPSVENMLAGLEKAYADWQQQRHPRIDVRSFVQQFEQDALYDKTWRGVLKEVKPNVVFSRHGTRHLMLASGKEKLEGFTHHDRDFFHDHIDVAHDLNVLPWPWEDESWDYIEFSDCLEHLSADVTDVMDELWRILAPGGYVFIHTAEAGSWQLNLDPTHRQGFYLNSFDYYDPDTQYGQEYTYSEKRWRVVKRSIDSGGLVFVLQPRKEEAQVAKPDLYAVPAGV